MTADRRPMNASMAVRDGPKLYFAYGSNMLLRRVRQPDRAPDARRLGLGRLDGWELRFDKIASRDGSGKCHVAPAGVPGARVWGVVYTLGRDDRRRLDRAEGVGAGYERATVAVRLGDGVIEAFTYVAGSDAVDPRLRPYRWYRDLVLAGAREAGLPGAYRRWIAATPAVRDPDRDRSTRTRSHLDLRVGGGPRWR